MSLEAWATNGWLVRHAASTGEIRDLLSAAEADLADAKKDLSPAWRFAIAYNAALRLCTAALHAVGFRASREQKHYRTIASLPLVVGSETRELADFLDQCRSKRHDVTYESLSAVSASEAEELIGAVEELGNLVRRWLKERGT
jgi:uncharacterized protein (UPF0332 family)